MTRRACNIEAELGEFAGLGREELVAQWAKAHGCAPPKGVRQELLVRSAAWHLQAKRLGGYSAETRRLLRSAIIKAGKRFADRTSALGNAGQIEDNDNRIDIHRLDGDTNAIVDSAHDHGHRDHIEVATSASSAGAVYSPIPPKQRSLPSLLTASAGQRLDVFVPTVSGTGHSSRQRRKLQPGARLLRDWNGKTHVVDVIEGGYVFEAKVYPSLTAIAGKITGVHWSGPRFFGL